MNMYRQYFVLIFHWFIIAYNIKIKVDEYVKLKLLRWICKANIFKYLIFNNMANDVADENAQ